MKKYIATVIILLALNTGIYSQQIAEPVKQATDTAVKEKVTGSFEMNYLRHYLWRGMLFGNNDVAQPVLELNYKNFTLGLSQNFNYLPANVPKDIYTKKAIFDEQDVEVRYSSSRGKISNELSAFAYFYFFQLATPNTAELSNWTGYNFYKDFSFFTENSIDIAAYSGSIYSNNGILYEHTNKHNLLIEWSAYAGFANTKFNGVYFESGRGGLNLVGSHIDITKELGKYFIKLSVEKDIYTKQEIKETTGVKGVENFGFAAGFNF